MNFTQNKEFRNSFDLKSLLVESAYRGVMDDSRLDNMLNEIRREGKMETRQEYLQGYRESNIRSLVSGKTLTELVSRIAQYGSDSQYEETKEMLINFVVENNLIDEDELR